jgi:hypothetical protein
MKITCHQRILNNTEGKANRLPFPESPQMGIFVIRYGAFTIEPILSSKVNPQFIFHVNREKKAGSFLYFQTLTENYLV